MEYVDFNLAKKLKEKGFTCQYPIAMYNELGVFYALYTSADCNPQIKSVFGNREYYDYDDFDEHDCVCPTISQVLKWLREEKKIFIEVYMYNNHYLWEIYNAEIVDIDMTQKSEKYSEEEYLTYEDAAIAGIEYVLDNLI